MARASDAEIRFYWNDQRGVKRWTIGWRGGRGSGFRLVETTVPLDEVAMQRLVDVVKTEMMSWLF